MSNLGMPRWSKALLGAYYYVTLPQRRRMVTRYAAEGRAPVAVLFYHRVADITPNGWTIRCHQFARQIHWLKRRFELISLGEAQRRITAGVNHTPAVCITFDDGYADNCQFALPMLIGARIPFTYFVSSRHVLRGEPFPHDVARNQPLAVNTVEQLRALVAAGVEIGAHTRSHADLGKITDPEQLADEVLGSRDDLAACLQCEVSYFAFPYGLHQNLNRDVFQLARESGFRGVCSAYGGYNFPGDDAFHLQRIHADPEMVRFRNWLTFDPRKIANTRRFSMPADARPPLKRRAEVLPAGGGSSQ